MNSVAIRTVAAKATLEACSRLLGKSVSALTPDAIAHVLGSVRWVSIPGWEKKSDGDIAAETGLHGIAFGGALFVVTEASLSKLCGACVVNVSDLARYIENHLDHFGECFFNGDVLIVSPETKRIWLFHHEGQFAAISLN